MAAAPSAGGTLESAASGSRPVVRRRALGSVWLVLLMVICSPLSVVEVQAQTSSKKKGPAKSKRPVPALKVDTRASLGAPSNEQPEHVLKLWSDGPAVQWRAQGWALAQQADDALTEIEQVDAGALKGKLTNIGRVRVLLLRLARASGMLVMWSEPAALDLNVRAQHLNRRLQSRVFAAGGEPSCQKIIREHFSVFEQHLDKQSKALAALRRQSENGDIKDSFQRALDMYDDLAVEEIWYPRVPQSYLYEFEAFIADRYRTINAEQSRLASDAIAQFRGPQPLEYAAVLKSLDEAVAALGAGGQAQVDGHNVDGPQALEFFLARWQELHFRALRVWAMDVPLDSNVDVSRHNTDKAAHNDFQSKIAARLIKLIEADAAQVTGPNVRRRYAAYLAVCAPAWSAVSARSTMAVETWQAALDKLAAKDVTLAAEVAAYRQATSGLLWWRSQLAAKQAVCAAQRNPPLTDKVFTGEFGHPLPRLMNSLSEGLLGKFLVGSQFAGVPETGVAISDCDSQQRFFMVPLDRCLEDEAAALRADLLMSTGVEPLTLQAAIAAAGVSQGQLVEAGGTVRRIELEAVTTLYAGAGAKFGGLARINEFPQANYGGDLRLRLELDPLWYRLPYCFVELKSPQQ